MNSKRFFAGLFRRQASAAGSPQQPPAIRKAAVLIASLDRATAETLLERMPALQAQLIRRAAAELGEVDPAEQASVMRALAAGEGAGGASEKPSSGKLSLSAKHALADELELSTYGPASPHAEPLQGPHFRLLRAASGDKLRPLLEGEHPQTIALVVSHLPAEQAAEMLASLAGSLQAEVVRRLVNLQQANPEVLLEVERGLESRILEQAIDERRQTAGMASVAGILAAAAPRMKREILANLSQHDRELAARLVDREFRFSELEQLSGEALAVVMDAAGAQLAVLALAGALPALHQRMLAAVPAETAAQLTAALEGLGPTRLSDVEEAQHEMAQLARQLDAEGRIDLSGVLAEAAF
ncbi:MAG TPA: FliG C-terminal domain-containing protein [Pirellulales bacterium]|jgi:flagellar motor switch protein FliG|nr:FliG C-terminal domain-containing protein [Pirellulales bacterium]